MKRIILLIMMAALLTGCGKKEVTNIKPDDIANRLLKEVTYGGNMDQMNDDMIAILYDVNAEDVSKQIVYCSTDATADEIAVFEATSEDAAKRVEEVVKQRVTDQKASFEGYEPKEVEKLEKAIVKRVGKVVVLSVSNDSDKANEILK
ncbi:protein of unknown function [Anaerosporobacter mobilis DSM 15930]|uniref:DUF4358 domain-containing protein n=1 Tax=Anaerosporobacter mobilis DSM 15930 TaxID=1120996 RepID=A0A1M7IIE4_9FIRM|nr:DUF4358 domain-containing protein [Anaerosporobacter mobilis]SHM40445.1 protein of unknown function [Anaerosporobacter mobilis DSM 15930]